MDYVHALLYAVIANVIFLGAMVLAQRIELGPKQRRRKIIGTEQLFLYWQDFRCQKYGNVFGMPFIIAGAIYIVAHSTISTIEWWSYGIIAVCDAIGFTLICLSPDHKPDWGYPKYRPLWAWLKKGEISVGGAIHSIYHGMIVGMAAMIICNIIVAGPFRGSAPMWITLAGGAFYVLTFLEDISAGRFEKIKKIGPDEDLKLYTGIETSPQ